MKPFSIGLIPFVLVTICNAQPNNTTSVPPVPPYINQIYYYQSDSLVSLEKNEAKVKSKTHAFGYGGSEAGFYMDGEKSSLRMKAADSIKFVVKTGNSMFDPSMTIKLYHFDSKKGNREAIMSSDGGMYGKAKKTENEISCNIQKSGNDVFILIPASKLVAGEYGFLNTMLMSGGGMKMSYTVFAFGVD